MGILNLETSPLLISLVVCVLAFLYGSNKGNYSIIEVVCDFLYSPIVLIYVCFDRGVGARKYILLGLVIFWSVQSGFNRFLQWRASLPRESSRIQTLKEKWVRDLRVNFFIFYLYRGFLTCLASLPFLLIALNDDVDFKWFEKFSIFLVGLGLIALIYKNQIFKSLSSRDNGRRALALLNRWCDRDEEKITLVSQGFVWLGFVLWALAGPHGWASFVAPIFWFYGRPPTRAQASSQKA